MKFVVIATIKRHFLMLNRVVWAILCVKIDRPVRPVTIMRSQKSKTTMPKLVLISQGVLRPRIPENSLSLKATFGLQFIPSSTVFLTSCSLNSVSTYNSMFVIFNTSLINTVIQECMQLEWLNIKLHLILCSFTTSQRSFQWRTGCHYWRLLLWHVSLHLPTH